MILIYRRMFKFICLCLLLKIGNFCKLLFAMHHCKSCNKHLLEPNRDKLTTDQYQMYVSDTLQVNSFSATDMTNVTVKCTGRILQNLWLAKLLLQQSLSNCSAKIIYHTFSSPPSFHLRFFSVHF